MSISLLTDLVDNEVSSTERTHTHHGCHVPAKLIEVFITFQKILFDWLFIKGGGDEIRFKVSFVAT